MAKKTIYLLIAVFFVSIILALIFKYQTSTSKSDTISIPSTWKIYTNRQYGFSFKYPPQYEVNDGLFTYWGDGRDSCGIKVVDTSNKVKDITGKLVNSEIFDLQSPVDHSNDPYLTTNKQKIILGDNVFEYSEPTQKEMVMIHYFKIKNIVIRTFIDNQYLINPLFNMILSTFKFD